MKKKYSISFFVAVIICMIILTFAYQTSYNHERKRAQEENQKDISVPTEGNASKENIYYLKDLNGFIAVYLHDRKTIFEYTNIRMEDLPEEVAVEVQNWKPMETMERLYGFLENYSS